MYADTHCHLCVALDDGPQTDDEALAMCELAWAEGVRSIACVAHQNDHWPDNTPSAIRQSVTQLARMVDEMQLAMELVPAGEVMVTAETWERWLAGELLTYADGGKYLLLEMPHNMFLDLRGLIARFTAAGVVPVLAHAERYPELLFGGTLVDEFIRAGCVIQVSSGALAYVTDRATRNALRDWAKRGVMHVLGSDAHSPRRRRPVLQAAVDQLSKWVGQGRALQIAADNGLAVLRGEPLRLSPPDPPRRKIFGIF